MHNICQEMRKCYETTNDIYVTILLIQLMLINPRLPSLATLLFNRPTRGILSRFNRQPVFCDNDESNLVYLLIDSLSQMKI